MIQLNLLPDIKLKYIKANRLRKTLTSISILVTLISVGLLMIVVASGIVQKTQIKSANNKIADKSNELKHKTDINKVLTVQNQLNKLGSLHASKPAVSNLFTYLNQVTPTTVSINNLHVDFAANTIKITGTADKLSSVNQYVDTLKYAKYNTDEFKDKTVAFSHVVLSDFGLTKAQESNNQPATYTVELSYNKDIFDITKKVNLIVPKKTTTRSSIDDPSDIFKGGPTSPSGGVR